MTKIRVFIIGDMAQDNCDGVEVPPIDQSLEDNTIVSSDAGRGDFVFSRRKMKTACESEMERLCSGSHGSCLAVSIYPQSGDFGTCGRSIVPTDVKPYFDLIAWSMSL